MLKTVSSITNAIGALNYKGTWNASANLPPLASGVGTKGDYYVVGTAGSTTLDGISNWGIGDWAVFNGSVWQRVEGGADLNGVNLSVSGTSTLDGNVTFKDNLTQGTAAKGVNFTANVSAPGMTSQLLNAYEEGTWTPTNADITFSSASGSYTRIGRMIYASFQVVYPSTASGASAYIGGLPYTVGAGAKQGACSIGYTSYSAAPLFMYPTSATVNINLYDNTGVQIVNSTVSGKVFNGVAIYMI